MTELIHETSATGAQIQDIVDAVGPVLEQWPRSHVLIACISIAILLTYPDITPEQLKRGVKGASQWICMFLEAEDETGKIPKALLN